MGYIGQAPTKVPLTSADITDGTIALADMAVNSVDSDQYVDGSIDLAHIATNQIDETLLKDALVGDFTDATVTASDYFLHGDATDSGNTKKDTIQGVLDLVPSGGLTTQVVESTYNIATASGTVDYTGAGFDPTAALCFLLKAVSQEVSYGWVDSGNDNSSLIYYNNVVSNSWTTSASNGIEIYQDGSNHTKGVFSLITDGIRITYTKTGTPTGTLNIYFLMMK